MKKKEMHTRTFGKMFQRISVLILALMLLCGMSITAFAAADSPSLDWSMSGNSSITVEMKDDSGSAVTDGTLTLYQVALLEQDDGNVVYTLTDAFSASGVSLDDVSENSSSLASELSGYVAENSSITGTAVKNTSGTVVFEGLELGLYLIVQTTQSEGYYTVNPFVVSVPLDEDGSWIYNVDASPKVGVLTPVPEETVATTDSPTETTAKTGTGLKLPQTGQLFWPIPVLAAAGAVLLMTGYLVTRNERKKAAVR